MMAVTVIRKHWRIMLLVLLITAVAGAAYCIYAPSVYYSRALIRVDHRTSSEQRGKTGYDSELRLIMQELAQPQLLERTARRFGITASYDVLRKQYLFKMAVRSNVDGNLEAEVWPRSKDWAEHWTETLTQEYAHFRDEKRLQQRQDAIEALLKEMAELTGKSAQSIRAEFGFKDKEGVTQALAALEHIRSVPLDLARVNKRLDEASRARVALQEPSLTVADKLSLLSSLHESPSAGTNAGDLTNPASQRSEAASEQPLPQKPPALWEAFVNEQRAIQARIADLARSGLPGDRELQAQNQARAEVDRKLEVELENGLRRFALDYEDLLEQKSELEAKLSEHYQTPQNAGLTSSKNQAELGQLDWNKKVSNLTKTIDALDFTGETERVALTYGGLLQISEQPIAPNRSRVLLFTFGIGVILSVGAPFLIHSLDHTVSSIEQVESTLRLRGLGIVPTVENQTMLTPLRNQASSRESDLTEEFERIRTNLFSVASFARSSSVTMVTSALPKEGKTAVSSNLALTFAKSGANTLLIDSDFRRGCVHRVFGYRRTLGLSNVLLDEIDLEQAIRQTSEEKLFVLTAGKLLQSGAELLGGQKLSELMALLQKRFERIVIDTPPVLGLVETALLQQHVDGVLFVIRSGYAPLRSRKAAVEVLRRNGANLLGFVLNRLARRGLVGDDKRAPNEAAIAPAK